MLNVRRRPTEKTGDGTPLIAHLLEIRRRLLIVAGDTRSGSHHPDDSSYYLDRMTGQLTRADTQAQTRELLIAAAAEVFGRRGYRGATLGDIAREALGLLERLAEADPYDERHYVQMAEVHLHAGNRRRALDALERAERILDDLGVAASPAVRLPREAPTAS